MTSFIIESDGGSRGNPGPAGYGAVVRDAADGQTLVEAAEALGTTTNNIAEYRGLIAGLRAVLDLGGDGAEVEIRMDSRLVVEQMTGRWKIKNETLKQLAAEATALTRRLRVTGWTWIPRERNAHADRLANEAMDAAAGGAAWQRKTSAAPDSIAQGSAVPDSTALITDQTRTGTGWHGPTTAATTLLLLRHGETPLSAERRFSGLGDPELTPRGLDQAARAAERLAAVERPEAIVSSPLKRARQTAETVARACGGLDVIIDTDLRETDFGDWEGYTYTEIQRRWPDELAAWLTDPDLAPPGGESFTAVAQRVQRGRDRLIERYEGRRVAVVSHVTPIKSLLRLALLAPPVTLYRLHLDLAGLSRIEYYLDGQAVVKSVNDTSHLR